MPLENRIEEKEDKLSAAIKPYLKYYNFTDISSSICFISTNNSDHQTADLPA